MSVVAVWDATTPSPTHAQTRAQTVAGIQEQIDGLYALVRGLQRQVKPTPGAVKSEAVSGSTQQRLDAIEARLEQLTNANEELSHHIKLVIADANNRLGDLEYRLCELKKGCDISKLGKVRPLGTQGGSAAAGSGTQTVAGAAASDLGVGQSADQSGGQSADQSGDQSGGQSGAQAATPDLAVNEQSDFNAAKAALDAGDNRKAVDLFSTFTQTYTAGPLTGQAHFYRGKALDGLGETSDAARAYLESFSGSPKGVKAAEALTNLGIDLGKLGQVKDACITLQQVSVRYPDSPAVATAAKAQTNLNCQ